MGLATLPPTTQGTQQIWSKNSPGVTPGVAQSPNLAVAPKNTTHNHNLKNLNNGRVIKVMVMVTERIMEKKRST